MIVISVMYPYTEGARFDWDYYTTSHRKLVEDAFGPTGMASVQMLKGVSSPGGGPPPYEVIALLTWPDQAAMVATMTGPRVGEVQGDLPNFTDIAPVRQISQVA